MDRVNVVQNWNNGPNGLYRPVQPAHLGRFSILSVSSTLSTLYSVEFYCLKQERSGRDGAKKGNPPTTFMVKMRMGYSHTLSRGRMGFLPESIMPPRPIERSSRAEGA